MHLPSRRSKIKTFKCYGNAGDACIYKIRRNKQKSRTTFRGVCSDSALDVQSTRANSRVFAQKQNELLATMCTQIKKSIIRARGKWLPFRTWLMLLLFAILAAAIGQDGAVLASIQIDAQRCLNCNNKIHWEEMHVYSDGEVCGSSFVADLPVRFPMIDRPVRTLDWDVWAGLPEGPLSSSSGTNSGNPGPQPVSCLAKTTNLLDLVLVGYYESTIFLRVPNCPVASILKPPQDA